MGPIKIRPKEQIAAHMVACFACFLFLSSVLLVSFFYLLATDPSSDPGGPLFMVFVIPFLFAISAAISLFFGALTWMLQRFRRQYRWLSILCFLGIWGGLTRHIFASDAMSWSEATLIGLAVSSGFALYAFIVKAIMIRFKSKRLLLLT